MPFARNGRPFALGYFSVEEKKSRGGGHKWVNKECLL